MFSCQTGFYCDITHWGWDKSRDRSPFTCSTTGGRQVKVSIPGMRPMFFLNMYFRQKYVACSLIFNVDNYIHSQYEISVFLFMLVWMTLELRCSLYAFVRSVSFLSCSLLTGRFQNSQRSCRCSIVTIKSFLLHLYFSTFERCSPVCIIHLSIFIPGSFVREINTVLNSPREAM